MTAAHFGGRLLSTWEVARAGDEFVPVRVPCTVAGLLRARGTWRLGDPGDFDRENWTFRCRFSGGDEDELCFEGLSPNAEIWLNGMHLATAYGMLTPLVVPVRLLADNLLEVRCLPTSTAKRPRPRWRSRNIDDQARRWTRVSALGHLPTLGPTFSTVGPWRPVSLRRRRFASFNLATRVEGRRGIVTIDAELVKPQALSIALAGRVLRHEGQTVNVELAVDDADLWWPSTHGAQPRYALRVEAEGAVMERLIAFRTLCLNRDFALEVNGVPVFCRGACWIPPDAVGLDYDPRPDLLRARDAGFNMIRVSGNTLYESDDFYAACTELGLLVWQDFMFASLDYPFGDAGFREQVVSEARSFLRRVQAEACLAVLCANTEVAMQALMLGVAAEQDTYYTETLPSICTSLRPDVPFVPGTPSGGALGIEPREGCSHYYGVGVFQRDLNDARLSGVRFASECLAFGQRPGALSRSAWHDTPWEHRIVRFDSGGGDFADANEHYLRALFRVDPLELRTNDRPLYDALLEIVPGLVMQTTLESWRCGSHCQGALIWLWRDIWRSCGWGLIDADGRVKAAYHYVRRALTAPVLGIDAGLNGLDVYLINESDVPVNDELVLELYQDDIRRDVVSHRTTVAARSFMRVNASALLGRFTDLTFAYRFGPRAYDVVAARWGERGRTLFFPGGLPLPRPRETGLRARHIDGGLELMAQRLVHTVVIESDTASDNFFHLLPGETRQISCAPGPVRISALGASERIRLDLG